jgi:hypothetical protein
VPVSILYDNLKIAVARILGDGKRQRTRAFTELVSHYLFQERFGRPGKGNDKGKVEALVKYSRASFLTPVPHAPSFEALNAALDERCRVRQAERAGPTSTDTISRFEASKCAVPESSGAAIKAPSSAMSFGMGLSARSGFKLVCADIERAGSGAWVPVEVEHDPFVGEVDAGIDERRSGGRC